MDKVVRISIDFVPWKLQLRQSRTERISGYGGYVADGTWVA